MNHSTPPSRETPPRETSPHGDSATTGQPAPAPRHGLRLPLILFFAGIAAIPIDGMLSRLARDVPLGGDIRRELELLQQFGAPASVVIALLLVIALDPARARRFLDWGVAAIVVAMTALGGKALLGRPRPKLDDPLALTPPWATYPLPIGRGENARLVETHAWDLGADRVEQLWSMPSSHTTAAVVFAVFLATVYPKLRGFAVFMAVLVMSCRVLFGAHYVSDVLIGAALALLIAPPMISNGCGVRLIDTIWIRFINKNAEPKWPVL
jgi:membrane-associated phospholipid phosphatase